MHRGSGRTPLSRDSCELQLIMTSAIGRRFFARHDRARVRGAFEREHEKLICRLKSGQLGNGSGVRSLDVAPAGLSEGSLMIGSEVLQRLNYW